MNWPSFSLIGGVTVALAGVGLGVLCLRRGRRLPALPRLAYGWLLATMLLGPLLSYIPWPFEFANVPPGPTTLRWIGVPAPMLAQRIFEGHHLLDPALHILAWILNGAFAWGLSVIIAFVLCRRATAAAQV